MFVLVIVFNIYISINLITRIGGIILKKFISILFTLLLLIFISAPVHASENELHEHEHVSENVLHEHEHEHEHEHVSENDVVTNEEGGDFGVMYIPCPEGGKHNMWPYGLGNHTTTTGQKFKGNLYQCAKCLMTLTTENNYFNSNEKRLGPGKYITDRVPYPLTHGGYTFPNKGTLRGPVTSWLTGIFEGMNFYGY